MAFQPSDDAKAIAASNLVLALAQHREPGRNDTPEAAQRVLAGWYGWALRVVDADSVNPSYED